MPSIPPSPQTPTRTRHRPPSIQLSDPSPNSPYSYSHSQNSSYNSPTTPRQLSPAVNGSARMEMFESTNDGNGLGSLADELADAWDEDELADISNMSAPDRENSIDSAFEAVPGEPYIEDMHDMGIGGIVSRSLESRRDSLSPPTQRHSRTKSLYDGSEYEYEDDEDMLDTAGLAPGLEAQMAAIEALARVGTQNNGGEMDGVVQRLIDRLEDLGSQSSIENGATRLITAHTALTSHITYQTRTLQSLTYSLLSPLSVPPSPETIDDLLPLLLATLPLIPQPTTNSLNSLLSLSNSTTDIISTFNYLSDTLHMSRQTTTAASRRLRSTKELVAEIRKDNEEREEGVAWIERGGWGERLEKRECAGVCRDVVGGFEEVCQGWRERLLAGTA
ncbi:MAG: hypothetical protein M1834_002702 [Cirrosporium novae-zelandiae]|nr:MAG: hypothetical protein M1834_002702 [Cirrosporium novae-zelandiae]